MVLSARLDVQRAETAYAKNGTKTTFQQVTLTRNELLRLIGLRSKYTVRQIDETPLPTVADIRAKKSFTDLKAALMDKYATVGPENEILIENIMSLVERQELMRLDPDADTKELMSIDLRISSNIEHLRKSLPTKDQATERAVRERTEAILMLVEGELINDAVKLRRILDSAAEAGYITAPGGKIGRAAKRGR